MSWRRPQTYLETSWAVGGNLPLLLHTIQGHNRTLWPGMLSPVTAGILWYSFLAHWQHSVTLTTFCHRLRHNSFYDTLDLLFNTIMPDSTRNVLLLLLLYCLEACPKFPWPVVDWSLFHRAHLCCYEKAIATISEYCDLVQQLETLWHENQLDSIE